MTGTHNNITGIPRCGLKTAIKWLNQLTTPAKMLENEELIKRNKALISLPIDTQQFPIQLVTPTRPIVNTRQIIRYTSQYGINYTGAMDKAFSQFTSHQSGEFDV